MEHYKIRNVRTQLLSQSFQMLAPLREHDRGAPVFKGLDYIFADKIIARLIGCQHRIELLDGGSLGLLFDRELGLADNERLYKWALCVLVSRIHSEPRRTELHVEDRLLTVPATWSCSESRDKPRLHFRKDALERNGRDVVAFIHDNVSIASHKVSYAAKANQALNHGNVDLAGRSVFSSTDLPDFFRFFTQEQRKLCDPLIEERLPVNKNERVSTPHGDQKNPYDGLASPRRCHQDAYVVSQ